MELVVASEVEVLTPLCKSKEPVVQVLSPYLSSAVIAQKIGLTTTRRLWDFKRIAALFIPEKYQKLLDPKTGGIKRTRNQLCEEDVPVMFRIRYLVNTYGVTETMSLMSNETVKELLLDSQIQDIDFAKQVKEIHDNANN